MNILCTGSAGFIGTHLMKALKTQGKHKLLGVDKKYGTNIVDFNKLILVINQLLGKPDLIIHLAAQTSRKISVEKPDFNFVDNVIGTFNILNLVRLTNAKLIFPSSRYAVPNTNGDQEPYGFSKKVDEEYIENFKRNYGIEYIINRIGNVYGPGQHGSQEAFWLPWFIQASIDKKPITIYGFEGKQSRDMLYIDDLIRLLMDEIENFDKYKGKTYEVGGGPENEISLLETLKILNYSNYNFGEQLPGDSLRLVFDNKEITAVNGWKPEVKIQDGIQKTIEDYKQRYQERIKNAN